MHLQINEDKAFNTAQVNKLKKSLHENNVIMLLHADWCYWCKQFLPEWNLFAKSQKNKQNLTVVEVEATQLDKVSQQDKKLYDLLVGKESMGFPTVVLFKDGQRFTYTGVRSKQALENHLNEFVKNQQKGGDTSSQLAALDKLDKSFNKIIRKHLGKST